MSAASDWRTVIASITSPIERAATITRLREDEPDNHEKAAMWWAHADAISEGLSAFRNTYEQFHDLPPMGAKDEAEAPDYDDLWAAGF